MQLVLEHLTTEQAAEDSQADGVRLVRGGLSGHVVEQLAQQDACHHGSEQHGHHADDVVGGACANRDINELLAEPDHYQTQHHLRDTCYDAHQGIPPDARHVTPYPDDVFHGLSADGR